MYAVHSLSIIMAEAPPPPLQMPAIPLSPGRRLCTRWPTMRAPDMPMGWPRETAPEDRQWREGESPKIISKLYVKCTLPVYGRQ